MHNNPKKKLKIYLFIFPMWPEKYDLAMDQTQKVKIMRLKYGAKFMMITITALQRAGKEKCHQARSSHRTTTHHSRGPAPQHTHTHTHTHTCTTQGSAVRCWSNVKRSRVERSSQQLLQRDHTLVLQPDFCRMDPVWSCYNQYSTENYHPALQFITDLKQIFIS